MRDFGSTVPGRGYRALGLVSRSTMIAIAAGKRGAKVIALNNYTGKDVWCALPSDNSEPRYFQPILIHHGHAHWWCGTRPRLNRSILRLAPSCGYGPPCRDEHAIATPACRRPVTLLGWFGIRTGHSY